MKIKSVLAGKRIVITRAPHQAGELQALLEQRGAESLLYPCIDIAPPVDIAPLDDALQKAIAGKFDWLVLSSTNTVLMLAQRLAVLGNSRFDGLAIAAIGPATAQAAQEYLHLTPQLLPEAYIAESLIEALAPQSGMNILLPQSDKARPLLANQLTAAGANVTTVVAYHTVPGTGGIDLPRLLATQQVDAITFTSSSTVQYFMQRFAAENGNSNHLQNICIACIGSVTAQAAQEHGLSVVVQPVEHTLEALVLKLEHYFS